MNNPLHTRATLFTNGKFGAMLPSGKKVIIIGYTHHNNIVFPDGEQHGVISTDGCRLLARPISGMTRQELNKIPVFKKSGMSPANKKQWLINSTESLEARDFLFMIDNGVCPLNQELFTQGIVLKHNGNI